MPGVLVFLSPFTSDTGSFSDSVVASTKVDERGLFAMPVPAGVYRLRFVSPNGREVDGPVDTVVAGGVIEHEYAINVPPRDDGQTYFGFQVEQQAQILPGQGAPEYPHIMANSRIEGAVLVQFVVDTTGRVEMPTFRVIRASDTAFVAPTRAFVARVRFSPASVGGRRVRQLVQLPLEYSLGVSR